MFHLIATHTNKIIKQIKQTTKMTDTTMLVL